MTRCLPTRAAIALSVLVVLAGCKSELYTSLNQQDAMEMVTLLLQHGIAADRLIEKDGTSTIEVDQGRIADAVTLLHENRYPRTDYQSMADVFKQQGMISSPTAERARYVFGLSQELSHTLNDIDGVLTAHVHIVLPDNDPLQGDGKPSAAAVFIRHDRRVDFTKMIPQIKMMVADSVEGLTYDKVSVVLLPVALPPVAGVVPPAPPSEFIGWGWVVAAAWPVAGGFFLAWRLRKRWLPLRRKPPSPVVPVTGLRRIS